MNQNPDEPDPLLTGLPADEIETLLKNLQAVKDFKCIVKTVCETRTDSELDKANRTQAWNWLWPVFQRKFELKIRAGNWGNKDKKKGIVWKWFYKEWKGLEQKFVVKTESGENLTTQIDIQTIQTALSTIQRTEDLQFVNAYTDSGYQPDVSREIKRENFDETISAKDDENTDFERKFDRTKLIEKNTVPEPYSTDHVFPSDNVPDYEHNNASFSNVHNKNRLLRELKLRRQTIQSTTSHNEQEVEENEELNEEDDSPPTPVYNELNSDGEQEFESSDKMATVSCIKDILNDYKVSAILKFAKGLGIRETWCKIRSKKRGCQFSV